MRKAKLLLVAFALGTMGLFANEIDTPNVSKDEIRKQIIELIDLTEVSLQQDLFIDITFTFNSTGEIVVLKVNSMDKDVLNFVRENLNGKKLDKPGKVSKEYTMPISVVSKY